MPAAGPGTSGSAPTTKSGLFNTVPSVCDRVIRNGLLTIATRWLVTSALVLPRAKNVWLLAVSLSKARSFFTSVASNPCTRNSSPLTDRAITCAAFSTR